MGSCPQTITNCTGTPLRATPLLTIVSHAFAILMPWTFWTVLQFFGLVQIQSRFSYIVLHAWTQALLRGRLRYTLCSDLWQFQLVVCVSHTAILLQLFIHSFSIHVSFFCAEQRTLLIAKASIKGGYNTNTERNKQQDKTRLDRQKWVKKGFEVVSDLTLTIWHGRLFQNLTELAKTDDEL